MNRWEKQLADHPIRAAIEQLKEYLPEEFEDTDEESFAETRRLRELIVHIEQGLNSLNAEIVPFNQIDVIYEHLSQYVTPRIRKFLSNGDIRSLIAANDYLTNHMSELSVLQSFCGDIAIKPKIEMLDKLTDQFVRAMSKKRDDLESEIAGFQTELAQQKDQQQQLSNAINAKRREANTLTTSWQDQFSQAQQQRQNDFNSLCSQTEKHAKQSTEKLMEAKENELSDMLGKTSSSVASLVDKTTKTVAELISDAEKKHKAILDLYEIVAGDSVAAGYINDANIERKAADFWRYFTLGFIILAAIWMFGVFWYTIRTDNAGFNWTWYLPVFSLTAVMFYGAAYSGGQSTKHRNSEKRNRWFALQMKAIDPFISSLDADQQKELKRELSSQLFGNSYEDGISKGISERAFATMSKGITDVIKAVKSK